MFLQAVLSVEFHDIMHILNQTHHVFTSQLILSQLNPTTTIFSILIGDIVMGHTSNIPHLPGSGTASSASYITFLLLHMASALPTSLSSLIWIISVLLSK